jgi:NAD(P)-dependent dehydrogenase (short-subunit alcohol dehydrogenase family)
MMNVSGKRVLVTGSSDGIGRAIAERIKRDGGVPFVHGLNPEATAATALALGNVPHLACDLAHPETPRRLVNAAITALGGLDGLVNNAGIYPRARLEETTLAYFDTMIAVNQRAPFFLCQHVVEHFRHQGGGVIVNIGSLQAHSGLSNCTAYAMTKGALMTMTRNLADALGPENIRVNQINPGWILTENENALQVRLRGDREWATHVSRRAVPRGRMNAPAEVAAHACFWLSDESAPANGQVYEMEQFPLIGRMLVENI